VMCNCQLTSTVYEQEFVVGIYFDLQKAFDTVDYDILIENCIDMT